MREWKTRGREEEGKKGRRRNGVRGRESEQLAEDVTDGVEVRRSSTGKTAQGRHEEGRKNCPVVQIFVEVDGSKAFSLDASLSDKVGDIAKRIPNSACCSKRDVYVTYEGRVIRRSDELRSSGVSDGSTLQVLSRMRGGKRLEDKKSKAERKQPASPGRSDPLPVWQELKDAEEPKSNEGPVIQECDGE